MPKGKIAILEERVREVDAELSKVHETAWPLQNELETLQERWRKLPQPKTADEALALAGERRQLRERMEALLAKLEETRPLVRRLTIERDELAEALATARRVAAEARRLLPARRGALQRAREEYETAISDANARLRRAEGAVEELEQALRELEGDEDAANGGKSHERAA
ncbi:MAG: hypothetical protein IMX02_02805 [Limnochordaceae bacterium]|nr:hypothetical protein [Limnochordaceae bacterium]